MSSQNSKAAGDFHHAALTRLDRMIELMEALVAQKEIKPTKDERVTQAMIAIKNGATSMNQVAKELGVARSTVQRSPEIRRALETLIQDRRGDNNETEDFRWQD